MLNNIGVRFDDGYKLEVLNSQLLISTRGAYLSETRDKKIINVMQYVGMLEVLQCYRFIKHKHETCLNTSFSDSRLQWTTPVVVSPVRSRILSPT